MTQSQEKSLGRAMGDPKTKHFYFQIGKSPLPSSPSFHPVCAPSRREAGRREKGWRVRAHLWKTQGQPAAPRSEFWGAGSGRAQAGSHDASVILQTGDTMTPPTHPPRDPGMGMTERPGSPRPGIVGQVGRGSREACRARGFSDWARGDPSSPGPGAGQALTRSRSLAFATRRRSSTNWRSSVDE